MMTNHNEQIQLDFFQIYYDRINAVLLQQLPPPNSRLHEAMIYAVTNGGKRLRPCLVYATGDTFGVPLDQLDAAACAVEFIHTYSLIHDDLPAMDDDDLRRGKPTCHKAFDEATAILAGDSLHSLALEILTEDWGNVPNPDSRLQMIKLLSQAIGSNGMAGGQSLDIQAVNQPLTLEAIEHMYLLKTGKLIEASIELAAIAATQPFSWPTLRQFAQAIGLAFQIQDDILDIESSTEVLGKPQYADCRHNKPTYPLTATMTEAKRRVTEVYQQAQQALQLLADRRSPLWQLAALMVNRSY